MRSYLASLQNPSEGVTKMRKKETKVIVDAAIYEDQIFVSRISASDDQINLTILSEGKTGAA